ncbi:hypothetical protein [Mycolicibacterium llatzerense]|uniref:hypothetical protein n=1 Tax=Mycolicibacterium llatzerense TaxID=280871 RepID=UPI0008DCFCEF|nr:hypothetical protein [Mycolicibacterium llatzerense]
MDRFDSDGRGVDAAFTTFRLPGRLFEMSLAAIVVVIVLHTLWDAANASGSFTEAPGPLRGAVILGVGYLAVRTARAGMRHRRQQAQRLGPDIERIDPR